jgi:Flp pilus assembly protein TadD
MIDWFNAREAAQIGASLADEFARPAAPGAARGNKTVQGEASGALEALLRRADREVRSLRLNFYKKAKFANSFKWRLIENGVAQRIADEVTQSLVLHLSQTQVPVVTQDSAAVPAGRADRAKAQQLFHQGNKCFQRGAYAEAAEAYEKAAELDSTHAEAHNNLGAALSQLGRYEESEQCFRTAIALKPDYSDPYGNLGILLRSKSDLVGAETSLRRALKLRPNYPEARNYLGYTLTFTGRLRDARACFAKVLKSEPRNLEAMHGMGQLAVLEGRFEEAEATFKRILKLDPKMASSLAALPGIRKMTAADAGWFTAAKEIAASGIHPLEEANLRFALGKYCDDVDDYAQAFQNFKRANELLKTAAEDYDREQRTQHIEDLIRIYTRDAISKIQGASASTKPIFVLGMPRSGTSLAEQIIASHPAARGAGELPFWDTVMTRESDVWQRILSESRRAKLAEEYLRVLESRSADALRIVDKTPVNSDYLGVIYSVFPNARVIYMQRDPIDTCLSCYFQQFMTGLNFTMDLTDLAHYYRGHQRLMTHWRATLPRGFILDVPYEGLVADQETWTRKMLEFLGLEWDERCLNFHENKRQVVTASAWQVRQKIYKNSVQRWRNYEKFIGPLKGLPKESDLRGR